MTKYKMRVAERVGNEEEYEKLKSTLNFPPGSRKPD